MKYLLSLLLVLSLSGVETSYAQEEKKQFIRKGLLRSTATIAAGNLLNDDAITINLHGILEYYVADNISLRGEGYYDLLSNLNAGTEGRKLQFNHSLFSGASYHFKTNNHFDPYLSLGTGIAISKATGRYIVCSTGPCPPGYPASNIAANPLISTALGFNFYFQRLFHLFGEARYIGGKNLSDAPTPISLSEIRLSFGLGFNLNLLKKK